MLELPGQLQNEVRNYLEHQVRSGFANLETLAPESSEVFADDAEPAEIGAFARVCLQEILTKYRAEQVRWPTTTDCDRLDTAFAALEASGIVARQNFWCCGTCGLGAIGEEIELVQAKGVQVRGYTFYHEQDTERAVEGGGVFLYYGALGDEEAPALEIAREIQETLQAHGLSTDWDGTFSKRIGVTMDWKRRLP